MKCPNCGAAELIVDVRDLEHFYRGEKAVISAVSGEFCPTCDEAVLAPDESSRVMLEMRDFNRQVNLISKIGLIDR